MLDAALFKLIIGTILAQEEAAGIPGTPIAQAFQPTQQGVNSVPTAYLFKLGDHRLGYPYRADFYDEKTETMIHTEVQDYETTFQISTLSIQDPTKKNQYSASDILNLIAYILQSAATVEIFTAAGVAILRVLDIRNPFFTDDYARNEAGPSFDFTIQHKQIVASTVPVLESTKFKILPV